MKNTTIKNYLTALTRANNATNRAQQWGAWAVAESLATSDQSLDEAVTSIREALKEAGWPQSTFNNSIPLIPFACDQFAGGEDAEKAEIPALEYWPTKAFAESVLECAGLTVQEAIDRGWDSVEEAVKTDKSADLKAEFRNDGAPDKVPSDDQIENRILADARKAKAKAGSGSKSLFDNLEKLESQLAQLTNDQLDKLEEMIEAVRDKREKAST